MTIEPRYWLIAFAASMPRWMGWLAAWLVNREADRLERAERMAVEAIGRFAKAFAPYCEPVARTSLRPSAYMAQVAAQNAAMARNLALAQSLYQADLQSSLANQLNMASQSYGGLGNQGADLLGSLFGLGRGGYGGGGSIP